MNTEPSTTSGALERRALPWPLSANHRSVLLPVLALSSLIVAIQLADPSSLSGSLALLVFPVAIAGLTFGIRGGLVAALVAIATTVAWDLSRAENYTAFDWIVRVIEVAAAGLIAGWFSELLVRAQTDLVASESLHRGLSELSDDVISRLSPAGVYIYVSPASERIFGYRPDQLVGRSGYELLDQADIPLLARRHVEMLAAGPGDVREVETRMIRRDGERIWVQARGRQIRGPDGNVVGVQIAARDITAAKRRDERIQRLAAAVEYSNDAVITTDLEGRVTSWNPAAERIYGFSATEAVGAQVGQVLIADSEEERAEQRALIDDALREPVSDLEVRRRRKDGRVVEISLSVAPIMEGETAVGVVGVSRDITHRKRVDAALAESENRHQVLSQLVSAQEEERRRIALEIHDDSIQAMAAALISLGTVRADIDEAGVRAELSRVEEEIEAAIDRLRKLLFALRPEVLDREGLRAALRWNLAEFGGETGIDARLSYSVDLEPPPEVRLALYRIIQEALLNVRQHAKASAVDVDLRRLDGGIAFEVADDGIGINGSGPGHGHLGLTAMRERAEGLGGHVEVVANDRGGVSARGWVPI